MSGGERALLAGDVHLAGDVVALGFEGGFACLDVRAGEGTPMGGGVGGIWAFGNEDLV